MHRNMDSAAAASSDADIALKIESQLSDKTPPISACHS
jgi:hypothetical protein